MYSRYLVYSRDMLSGLIACLHELRHLLREKLNLRVALLQLLLQLGVGVGAVH